MTTQYARMVDLCHYMASVSEEIDRTNEAIFEMRTQLVQELERLADEDSTVHALVKENEGDPMEAALDILIRDRDTPPRLDIVFELTYQLGNLEDTQEFLEEEFNELRAICERLQCIRLIAYEKPANGEVEDCSICLTEYEPGEDCCRLPCNHCFHWHCATQWLDTNNSCPLCRASVEAFEER